MLEDMSKRRRFTQQQREELLTLFDKSSMRASVFCREQDLNYQTFLTWRRRDRKSEQRKEIDFVEVEWPLKQETQTERHNSHRIELLLPGGMSLRIEPIS